MYSGRRLPPLREIIPSAIIDGSSVQNIEERHRHQAPCRTDTYGQLYPPVIAANAQLLQMPFRGTHRPSWKTTNAAIAASSLSPKTLETRLESVPPRFLPRVDSARSSPDITRSLSQDQASIISHSGADGVTRIDYADKGRPHEQTRSKNENEKRKREDLSAQYQALEQILEFACGISNGEAQQPANRTSSGLTVNKKDTFKHAIAICGHLVTKGIQEAIANGNIDQHFAEMREVIDRCDRSDNPTHGTIMDDGGALPCVGEKDEGQRKKLRRCVNHDHPDWVECGKIRTKAVVERNIARLKATGATNPGTSRVRHTRGCRL